MYGAPRPKRNKEGNAGAEQRAGGSSRYFIEGTEHVDSIPRQVKCSERVSLPAWTPLQEGIFSTLESRRHDIFRVPARLGLLLFCVVAIYFVIRGPWRAIGSINSYDFASVYGASRCWLHGENPYDMRLVSREVHDSGDDPASLPNTDPPPSVYLPTALPVIASVAWLPWKAARLVWSLLSIGVFLLSVVLILRNCTVAVGQKWLLGAGVLLFSPISSGLSTGNPSVISCALTLIAILFAFERRALAAAIFLGAAHCIKPQISIAGFVIILIWGYWRTVGLSLVIPVLGACASFLRTASFEQYQLWLLTLRNSIAELSLPGGLNDASPANYFSYHLVNEAAILSIWLRNVRLVNALGWITAAVLAGTYCWRRRQDSGDHRLRDIAFFCTLCLVPVYHRYYDAQLLLGILPFLFATAPKLTRTKVAVWGCLAVLLFPLQALLATSLSGISPASPGGFLLLRHQPIIVLLLCILIIPWSRRSFDNFRE
jgi:glycosyl transferase family 87